MTEKWKFIIKKTTEFSFDPKYPRGLATGHRKGTDEIVIGLPAWKKTVKINTEKKFPHQGPKYFDESDLEGSERLIEEISNTIGHEYAHIATLDEFNEETDKVIEQIGYKFYNKSDYTQELEQIGTIAFLKEMFVRAGHGKMQQEVFLNRSVLTHYTEKAINQVMRRIVGPLLASFKQNQNKIITPEKFFEAAEQLVEQNSKQPLIDLIGESLTDKISNLVDKTEEVIPRKMMSLATKYRDKYNV